MLAEHGERSLVLIDLKSNRDRTILASAILVVGATGTFLDPNGPVGIVLFGVAAVALLYLIGRLVQTTFGPMKGTSLHLRSFRLPTRPEPVPGVARGRTVVGVVAAMSVLFAVWLTADLSRPLVYACWWSFCLLVAWLVTIGFLTATRRFRHAR
jgi:hypothetical protein